MDRKHHFTSLSITSVCLLIFSSKELLSLSELGFHWISWIFLISCDTKNILIYIMSVKHISWIRIKFWSSYSEINIIFYFTKRGHCSEWRNNWSVNPPSKMIYSSSTIYWKGQIINLKICPSEVPLNPKPSTKEKQGMVLYLICLIFLSSIFHVFLGKHFFLIW